MRSAGLVVFVGCSLFAAESAVEGPKLGYVNSAAGVRGLLGSVGASRLTAPITGELKGAVVAPGSDAVLAVNPDGALVRIYLKDGSVAGLGVDSVSKFAVSPSGSTVVAKSRDRVVVVSVTGDAKTEYALPGSALQVAVSDDATAVAVSVVEEGGEALYLLSAQGARRVFQAASIAGFAFVPSSTDMVFAASDGAIYFLKQDLQLTQTGTIPGVRAVAGTRDGHTIAVAGKVVVKLKSDGSVASRIECSCDATMARPLGDSRFLLTSGDEGPIWLVDASTSDLRVAFVPEAVNE